MRHRLFTIATGVWAIRLASIGLAAAAVGWAIVAMRQVLESDDGGPPLGALCMSIPSVVLLIAAGAVWRTSRQPAKGTD